MKPAAVKVVIVAAVITTIVAILAAVLPQFLKRSRDKVIQPPTEEDLLVLEEIREILTANQALNARYAELQASYTMETPFAEIFSTLDSLAKEKVHLLEQVDQLEVTHRYRRLYHVLREALSSDQLVFVVELQDLMQIPRYLEVMNVPPMSEYEQLSEEEKRARIFEDLMEFGVRNKEWLKRSEQISSQLKTSRANSSLAIQMLNEELEKLSLPYRHDNPFEPEPKTATDLDEQNK